MDHVHACLTSTVVTYPHVMAQVCDPRDKPVQTQCTRGCKTAFTLCLVGNVVLLVIQSMRKKYLYRMVEKLQAQSQNYKPSL